MGTRIRLQILETACEVAWQLMFPGAVFELGLSAGCAVFKEMAEWFCSGCWQGMGRDEEKLTVPSSCAQGQERKKKRKVQPGWLSLALTWPMSWCPLNAFLVQWSKVSGEMCTPLGLAVSLHSTALYQEDRESWCLSFLCCLAGPGVGESWGGRAGWALQLWVACPPRNPGGPREGQWVRSGHWVYGSWSLSSVDSVTFIGLKMASLWMFLDQLRKYTLRTKVLLK